MSKAVEAISKMVSTENGCPILNAIHDCGKCPYVEDDDEICEKEAVKEIKGILCKLNMLEDLP